MVQIGSAVGSGGPRYILRLWRVIKDINFQVEVVDELSRQYQICQTLIYSICINYCWIAQEFVEENFKFASNLTKNEIQKPSAFKIFLATVAGNSALDPF